MVPGGATGGSGESAPLIRFRLDANTGMAPYRQLVDQVTSAVRLGILRAGDQLPSVREVVTQITINPNTVHRAYRELEVAGIVAGRPGLGTFVAERAEVTTVSPRRQATLYAELLRWVRRAHDAGIDHEGIRGLQASALAEVTDERKGLAG